MNKKSKYLKLCIWTGVVMDAISVLLYVFPNLLLGSMGLPKDMLSPVAVYLLFHGGIFMLAWTILLIWAAGDPVSRRVVLLLTVLITVGLEASALYLLTVEGIAKGPLIPLAVIPVLVGGMFAGGYLVTENIRRNSY